MAGYEVANLGNNRVVSRTSGGGGEVDVIDTAKDGGWLGAVTTLVVTRLEYGAETNLV